jgi:NAD(P)-dependent dehydrogenase (short-subunit alcohol dehydrogenase family)
MARIRCCGTSRARCVAAPSAPRSTSGRPKAASWLAITMSTPPPRQKPCTAAGPASTARLPEADGRAAMFVCADIRDVDQARDLVRAAVSRLGRLDVLVSNAGGSPAASAATASPRFHARIIELNLIAPLHVAQAANASCRTRTAAARSS